MTHTEAIEKVRKLLALTTSDNPHEAAAEGRIGGALDEPEPVPHAPAQHWPAQRLRGPRSWPDGRARDPDLTRAPAGAWERAMKALSLTLLLAACGGSAVPPTGDAGDPLPDAAPAADAGPQPVADAGLVSDIEVDFWGLDGGWHDPSGVCVLAMRTASAVHFQCADGFDAQGQLLDPNLDVYINKTDAGTPTTVYVKCAIINASSSPLCQFDESSTSWDTTTGKLTLNTQFDAYHTFSISLDWAGGPKGTISGRYQ